MLWRAGGHHAVRLELSSGRYLYIGAADCEDLPRISERLPALRHQLSTATAGQQVPDTERRLITAA